MRVFAVFAFRNSFINDKANHANMFLACRKKSEEKKPIKSKRKTYLRPFSPKNRNNDKRKHVFLKTTRVFGLERLFCYCRLLTSGRAVTRDKLGGVSHFHSVFGQAFSLLSPRPLPAPFDSPHFLLSSVSRAKTFARPKKTPALQANEAKIKNFLVRGELCAQTWGNGRRITRRIRLPRRSRASLIESPAV